MVCSIRSAATDEPPALAGGFTLVELIIVILLLGVLSVFAVSRMTGATAYTPALVAGELTSMARLAQQAAMSRQDATVSLSFDPVADDWRLRVLVDAGTGDEVLHTTRTAHRGSVATVANGALNVPIDSTNALRVVFDGLGNVSNAAVGVQLLNPTLGMRIDVTGDVVYDLCIAPTGFVHRGSCA